MTPVLPRPVTALAKTNIFEDTAVAHSIEPKMKMAVLASMIRFVEKIL